MDYQSFLNSKFFINHEEILSIIEKWRFQNEIIVFTNGVFDILHFGHIQYLSQAASFGSKLIIGLNSDTSTQILKGKNRPINNQLNRSNILAALLFVDMIVLFEEITPISLIKYIKPDVLVKGGDYQKKDIVGAKFVERYGGKVVIISFVEGYSTSSIIDKLSNPL